MGRVKWQDRLLVPVYEPLQTTIIHRVNDYVVAGHPGREATFYIFLAEILLVKDE